MELSSYLYIPALFCNKLPAARSRAMTAILPFPIEHTIDPQTQFLYL
jgi:hypothetical protein